MKVAVLKEIREFEGRVAATPETVKKMTGLGLTVSVEADAGLASSISNDQYKAAGASVAAARAELLKDAGIILKVQRPTAEEVKLLPARAILIGFFQARFNPELISELTKQQVTTFSLDGIPRITRAQRMDVLSSQSNIAGYKAVLLASDSLNKMMPLMMTAAGTVTPARVLVLGAGVAGLQAIATAKRLGAVVEAFDTRPVVKEQVESLGAKFLELEISQDAKEDAGGYAKELSEEEHRKEMEMLAKHTKDSDIVITTALIPGRPAPLLITADTVKQMKKGSVIVDLAAENGGNCELTEKDKKMTKDGVTIIGYTNVPSLVAYHASQLYSRNLLNFLGEIVKKGELQINTEDEVVRGALANEVFSAAQSGRSR